MAPSAYISLIKFRDGIDNDDDDDDWPVIDIGHDDEIEMKFIPNHFKMQY